MVEHDPLTLQVTNRVNAQDKGDERNCAMLGDSLYYRTDTEYNMFRRETVGGNYVRLSLDDPPNKATLKGPGTCLKFKASG